MTAARYGEDAPPAAATPCPAAGGALPHPQLNDDAARRYRRASAAINRWLASESVRAADAQAQAFASCFWTGGGPWCAAWAGEIDLLANGGPSERYRRYYSISGTRRVEWAHTGSGRDRKTGKILRPGLGPEYAPKPPAAVQVGDIVTVGKRRPGGGWRNRNGQHTTIAVVVLPDGIVGIGGNQHGLTPGGRVVSNDVAATFYAFTGDGLCVQHVVSIPGTEYPPSTLVHGTGREAYDLRLQELRKVVKW